MQKDWILDVLADLETFSSANGLSRLAEHLAETKLVAAAEIASQSELAQGHLDGATRSFGPAVARARVHNNA